MTSRASRFLVACLACLALAAPALAQDDQPRVYISVQMMGIESILMDDLVVGGTTDLANPDSTRFWLGWEATFDFRITQRFGMGVYLDYLEPDERFGDVARVMAGVRFLGLIQVGSVVLVPFGRIGLNSAHSLVCDSCDPNYGYNVGGGFGVKWMFLSFLGLGANFDIGYRVLMWDDEQGRGVDVNHLDLGFDLGLTAAF